MEEQIQAQLEECIKRMEAIDAKHVSFGKKLKPLTVEVESLREAKGTSSKAAKRFEKKYAKLQEGLATLVDLQKKHNDLQAAFDLLKEGIKAVDAKRGAPSVQTDIDKIRARFVSPASLVTKNPAYVAQKRLPKELAFKGPTHTPYKGSILGGFEVKDSDLTDPDSALASVFIDESNIISAPQRVPVHRQLFTVVPLPGVESITVKRKTRPLEYVCKATAVANIGANAIVVDRIAGLLVDTDFNTIRVHNDVGGDLSTFETHRVTTVAATSAEDPNGPGTLTFAATVLAIAVAIGDTITFDQTEYIGAGQLKPKGRAVYDEVTISIRVLAEWIEVTTQTLMWSGMLNSSINGDLLEDLARKEEFQVLFGDNTAGQYRGVLNDTSINTITWSALTVGTTRLDCIVHGIVAAELSEYHPTWLYLNPQDWRELLKSKGSADGQYIYAEAARTGEVPRMWGLELHKSTVMPSGTALVGEQRSATIYDSMAGTITVGTINDQFVKNTRTILAELFSASFVGHPSSLSKIVWDSAPV